MADYVNLTKSTSQTNCTKSSLCLKALEKNSLMNKNLECLWFLPNKALFIIKMDLKIFSRFISSSRLSSTTIDSKWDCRWPSKNDTLETRALFRYEPPSMQKLALFCVSIQLTRFTWHDFHSTIICYQLKRHCEMTNELFLRLFIIFIPLQNLQDEVSGLFMATGKFIKSEQ